MQFQPNARQLARLISRRMQIAFVCGLLLGIMLGWLFSGVVSTVMRFGLLALLLVPLVLAITFWWKVRNAKPGDGPTVVTWSSGGLPPMQDDLFRRRQRQEPLDDSVIDVDQFDQERRS